MIRDVTIGIVGAGAVGRTLYAAFARAGCEVRLAHARAGGAPDESAHWAPSAQACAEASTLTFLTVPDDRIREVCEAIAWPATAAVVHCSGATPLDALAAARRRGAAVGGFHPLQMFANPAVALAGLAGCTVTIEADARLRPTLVGLARTIGLRPIDLPPGARARYHASAYYVGPFAIALLHEAAAIWQSFGATEAEALAALGPLLRGTLEAARDRGLAGGMGGCVARGDIGTLRSHLEALDTMDPEIAALYRTLARRTVPLALERGSITPAIAAALREALDERPVSRAGGA